MPGCRVHIVPRWRGRAFEVEERLSRKRPDRCNRLRGKQCGLCFYFNTTKCGRLPILGPLGYTNDLELTFVIGLLSPCWELRRQLRASGTVHSRQIFPKVDRKKKKKVIEIRPSFSKSSLLKDKLQTHGSLLKILITSLIHLHPCTPYLCFRSHMALGIRHTITSVPC